MLWIVNALLTVFETAEGVIVVVETTATIVCFCSVGNENGNGACVTCVLLWALTTCCLTFTRYSLETLCFLFSESFWVWLLLSIVTVAKSWEEKKMVFSLIYIFPCSLSIFVSVVLWLR